MTTTAMTMTPTRTYLRVKRPRHVASLPSLRVEGLLESGSKRARPNTDENLAQLLHQSTYIAHQQKPTSSSAVWKRVAIDSSATPHDAEAFFGKSNSKRSLRFVDAVLDDMQDNDDPTPRKKKRRLALTLVHGETTTTPAAPEKAAAAPPAPKNVILDPVSRLIQESLTCVLSGERTLSQHLEFLVQDSRIQNTRRALQWTDVRGAGNVLHAAALLNDVEGASAILAWDYPELTRALDGDRQTPYQLAMAVGHEQVAQVLELHSESADDEVDYVYDVFCLDDDSSSSDQECSTPTRVELRGGIGYWNDNGELILEPMSPQELDQEESYDDDDEDSNCEDHQGNDYPEEDAWEDDDDSVEEVSFRHHPIYMMDDARVDHKPYSTSVEDNDDDEYNAEYGLYDGPSNMYAYDSELDRESD